MLPDRIVLTGFMGSGKTTTGALLATRLGWRFFDLDREIERAEGRSIAQIFTGSGEPHFRRLESATLAALLREAQAVLALGGGAAEDPANQHLLQHTPHTAVVHLTAPLDVLLERCRLDPTVRPNLPVAAERFATRHPVYERLATHTLDTSTLTPEAAVTTLLTAFHNL
jgi:shikimate kinase